MQNLRLLILLPGILIVSNLCAQILPPKDVILFMEVAEENSPEAVEVYNSDPEVNEGNILYNIQVIVPLFSAVNVDRIQITVGTSPESADIAQHTFPFDSLIEPRSPGQPFSYIREGRNLIFGMGQVMGGTELHVKVILLDKDGKASDPRYHTPF